MNREHGYQPRHHRGIVVASHLFSVARSSSHCHDLGAFIATMSRSISDRSDFVIAHCFNWSIKIDVALSHRPSFRSKSSRSWTKRYNWRQEWVSEGGTYHDWVISTATLHPMTANYVSRTTTVNGGSTVAWSLASNTKIKCRIARSLIVEHQLRTHIPMSTRTARGRSTRQLGSGRTPRQGGPLPVARSAWPLLPRLNCWQRSATGQDADHRGSLSDRKSVCQAVFEQKLANKEQRNKLTVIVSGVDLCSELLGLVVVLLVLVLVVVALVFLLVIWTILLHRVLKNRCHLINTMFFYIIQLNQFFFTTHVGKPAEESMKLRFSLISVSIASEFFLFAWRCRKGIGGNGMFGMGWSAIGDVRDGFIFITIGAGTPHLKIRTLFLCASNEKTTLGTNLDIKLVYFLFCVCVRERECPKGPTHSHAQYGQYN